MYTFNPFTSNFDNTNQGAYVLRAGDTMTGKLTIQNSGGNNQIDLIGSGGSSIIRDTVDGNGVSIQGLGNGYYGKLRIVNNGASWSDRIGSAYFQIDNSNNSHASTFMSGDYGSDTQFVRLQFSSHLTTISDYFYNATPVPTGILEVLASNDKRVLLVKANSTQTNKILEVTDSSGNDYLSVDGSGNTVIGSAALATNAANGFLYIPTCAGAPTGTPTTQTGMVAMIYDSTNNNFYIYNGAWKKVSLT